MHELLNFLQFIISLTWIWIEFINATWALFILLEIIYVLTCLWGSKVKSVCNTVHLDENIVQLLQLYPKAIMTSSHNSCPICSKSYNPTFVIPLHNAFVFQKLAEGILNASSSAVSYFLVSQKWGIDRASFWIDISELLLSIKLRNFKESWMPVLDWFTAHLSIVTLLLC